MISTWYNTTTVLLPVADCFRECLFHALLLDRCVMIDRPWLAHYDPGVPHEIDIPPIALPELLARAAREHPDAPAISFYGRTIGYAELDTLASRFAGALVRAGVVSGERIVLVLPNVPAFVIGYERKPSSSL